MAAGPLVGFLAQSTTTTTGTGPLTIANTVPAGAPPFSTTFAAMFAPTGVYPVANIFYTIIDASSNIEAGYGTLTSATNLNRDFVIFQGTANTTAPYVPAFNATPTSGFLNLAAGTANVYSNPALLSAITPYQARFPNFTGNNQSGTDGGVTEDIMQGSFQGSITNGGTPTVGTVKYKVSSNGIVTIAVSAAFTNNTTGTTSVLTGVPSYLCNVSTQTVPAVVVSNSANVLGGVVVTAGATPTSTGTFTLQQGAALSGTFTTAVANGLAAGSFSYSLY